MTRLRPILCLVATLSSCGPVQSGGGGVELPPLAVETVFPDTWLAGTHVVIKGEGFVPSGIGTMTVTLAGTSSAGETAVMLDLAYEGPDRAGFVVSNSLLEHLPVDGGLLSGTVTVERSGGHGVAGRTTASLSVRVVSGLVPVLSAIQPAETYPGEEMTVKGDGFLMAGEGTTLLRISGWYRPKGSATAFFKESLFVPLDARDRTRAAFVLTPDIMGLGPGVFEGSVSVTNQIGDRQMPGNALDGVTATLNLPYLKEISPMTVRRGQELVFSGKGFLGVDGDLGTATFFAFTGTVTGPDGTEVRETANPLVLVPDSVTGNSRASLVVRVVEGPDGKAAGFGARPAVLDGVFTPHVLHGNRVVVGAGLPAVLEVGRQVQVVFVRFLPTFEDGLQVFGLAAVAPRIRQRVLEVANGDYEGISIAFQDERPSDFVEYTTVEVMGRDPNKAGLLGLDNSFGKDVGNLRLDDLVGGYNAESDAAGYFAYGGVFVESFVGFSPGLGGTDLTLASPAFDEIFGPVMPALGGTPVAVGEYPGGMRDAAIERAIRVLGNLIGDTVSHETGHALGLAAVSGEFHDPGDNPGFIMDAGASRPFEERAQLGGPGVYPRVFAPYDRAYLEALLPVQ